MEKSKKKEISLLVHQEKLLYAYELQITLYIYCIKIV